MNVAQHLPEWDLADQFIDGLVSMVGRRDVIDHQNQAGEQFDKEKERCKEAQPEGMREESAGSFVVAWADMKQKAGGMHLVTRIGLFGGRVAAHDSPQFIQAETGG